MYSQHASRHVDQDLASALGCMCNSGLAALRLMEVRVAYATEDFEWDNLQRLSTKDLVDGNVRIMRRLAAASLAAALPEQTSSASASGAAAASFDEPPAAPAGTSTAAQAQATTVDEQLLPEAHADSQGDQRTQRQAGQPGQAPDVGDTNLQ
jgi:hypothetical protein